MVHFIVDSELLSSNFNGLKIFRSTVAKSKQSKQSNKQSQSSCVENEILKRKKICFDLSFFESRFISHIIEIFSSYNDNLFSLKYSIYKCFLSFFLLKKLVDSDNNSIERSKKNDLEIISIDYQSFLNNLKHLSSSRQLIKSRDNFNLRTAQQKPKIYLNFIDYVEKEQIIRTW